MNKVIDFLSCLIGGQEAMKYERPDKIKLSLMCLLYFALGLGAVYMIFIY